MALHDFWKNVRAAAKYLGPQVIADAPRLDVETIERTLREGTSWLTPRAVAGFEVREFAFLPDDERSKLAELVAEFHLAASSVSPTAPVPEDTIERAIPLFRDIVRMLEFDRYGDAEALRLGKTIECDVEVRKLPEIAELRFNTGLDHSGDPALWIWVFLTEDISRNDDAFLKSARRLRAILDPIARREAPDRWPYLSFRPIVEPAEAVEAS